MADRVHPRDSPPPQPPVSANDETSSESSEPMLTLATRPNPCPDKPVPPPGTYVIHIPKDQVYRVPPPENANRYQALTRKSKTRRRPCCRCLCWSLGILAFLLALLAVSAAIFYLVVKPRSPNYSVDAISVSGLNLTAADAAASTASLKVSPEFDVTVRADNPNDKIGIYYEPKSSVEIYYDDPSNNVTVFETALKGSGVVLTSTVKNSLLQAQSQGKVPLLLTVRAPVKIKVGSVKSWTITVKVDCDITVDSLTANAKIFSKDCHYGVKIW
nr:ndr1/hin1-like protein 13 [Quercus suber]